MPEISSATIEDCIKNNVNSRLPKLQLYVSSMECTRVVVNTSGMCHKGILNLTHYIRIYANGNILYAVFVQLSSGIHDWSDCLAITRSEYELLIVRSTELNKLHVSMDFLLRITT